MNLQQASQGRSHVFFSAILFYQKSYSCYFLNWHVLFQYFYYSYFWSSSIFFRSLNLNQLTLTNTNETYFIIVRRICVEKGMHISLNKAFQI